MKGDRAESEPVGEQDSTICKATRGEGLVKRKTGGSPYHGPQKESRSRGKCVLFLYSFRVRMKGYHEDSIFIVHVVRMEINLYCFPYDSVHVSGFLGQDTDVILEDMMTQVDVMPWPTSLDDRTRRGDGAP